MATVIKHNRITEMKQWETAAFPVVKRVVDKHDPESLLKLGCPKYEYDFVSRSITSALVREKGYGKITHMTEFALTNIIALSFHISFGSWSERISYYVPSNRMSSYKFYMKVAKDLFAALVKANLLSKRS